MPCCECEMKKYEKETSTGEDLGTIMGTGVTEVAGEAYAKVASISEEIQTTTVLMGTETTKTITNKTRTRTGITAIDRKDSYQDSSPTRRSRPMQNQTERGSTAEQTKASCGIRPCSSTTKKYNRRR